jgi:hypothetical protein
VFSSPHFKNQHPAAFKSAGSRRGTETEKLFAQCKQNGKEACRAIFNGVLPAPWEQHKNFDKWGMGDKDTPKGDKEELGQSEPWPWDSWQGEPMWYPIQPFGAPPSPRHRHCTAVLEDNFFVFGGFGPEGFLGDLHVLNATRPGWLNLGKWQQVDAKGMPDDGDINWQPERIMFLNDPKRIKGIAPSPRAGHACATVGRKIVMYGGYSSQVGLYGDVFVLEAACGVGRQGSKSDYQKTVCPRGRRLSFTWVPVKMKGVYPTPRFGHSFTAVIDSYPTILALGGYAAGGQHGNWLKRRPGQGFRIDGALLDLMTPNVTEVVTPYFGRPPLPDPPPVPLIPSPLAFLPRMPRMYRGWGPPPAVTPPVGHGPTHGMSWAPKTMATPIRLSVLGRNFGVASGMVCDGTPGGGCAEERAVGVTVGNKDYGPFPCMPLRVISPQHIECDMWEGVGMELDVLVHANGQLTIAGNKLFNYDPPEVVTVVPPFIIDFCSEVGSTLCLPRGPLLIHGDNFGPGQKYVQDITVGGARCLKWKWVSHQLLICLCVGESKKDENDMPLQGGVVVKVGGQWSNSAPFMFIAPPISLVDAKPNVWYPVMCPGETLLARAGVIVSKTQELAQTVAAEEREEITWEMNEAIHRQDVPAVEEALAKYSEMIFREQAAMNQTVHAQEKMARAHAAFVKAKAAEVAGLKAAAAEAAAAAKEKEAKDELVSTEDQGAAGGEAESTESVGTSVPRFRRIHMDKALRVQALRIRMDKDKALGAAGSESEGKGTGSPLPIEFAPPGAISAQIRKATMAARHSMEDAMRELDALPVSWQKHYLMAVGGGDLVNEDTQMQLRADNRNARGDKTEEGDLSGDSKRNAVGTALAEGQRKVKESAYMLSQVRVRYRVDEYSVFA